MKILAAITVLTLVMLASTAHAQTQEFLDTMDRWKSLKLPVKRFAFSFSMVALRAHVVIGTTERQMYVSRDSGETWTDVGDALPEGITTVWALAYPDTNTTPSRILGIGSSKRPSQSFIIESTDGGFTWTAGQHILGLDTLFNTPGPDLTRLGLPGMLFAKSNASPTPMGFIYSGAGLFVSSDGGATWTHRTRSIGMRALAMADESNGIASFIEFPFDTSGASGNFGGLSWTSDGGATWTRSHGFPDGGFFQFHNLHAFSKNVMHAFIPERYQNYLDWRLLRSSDGGRSWDYFRGLKAERPLHGTVFWRDTLDLHVICDGAIIQHSDNGGEYFHVLRDTAARWPFTRLESPLIAGAPISATDGQYIYFSMDTLMARWRMADAQPAPNAAVVSAESALQSMRVVPNPVDASGARLLIGSDAGVREITIVDALGRVHAVLDVAGRRSLTLPDGLPMGRYTAIARGSRMALHVAFVVVAAR